MTSNDDTKSEAEGGQFKRYALIGALAVFLIGGFWFWRPWWHWLAYTVVYKAPGMLQWLLVGTGICLTMYVVNARADGEEDDETGRSRRSHRTRHRGFTATAWHKATGNLSTKKTALFGLGILVMVGGLIVGLVAGGVYANLAMSESVEDRMTTVDTLPDTDEDNPRILPYEVSKDYAQNSMQYPRHKMAGGDITYIDGTPHWSYGLAPDGMMNSLFAAKQEGAVYVDMTTSDSSVTVKETTFEKGQGMAVWRNYEWQLLKHEYTADYQDPMMVPHEGDQYMVIPYIEHDHKVRFTPLPQVYSVPEFGGVKIMHSDGTIEDVSPSEVSDHPVLEGQRVYPYDLARFEVNSMRYKHGAINKWFFHDEELQLAGTPGEGNEQPFTVTTDEGIRYVTAVEPANSGSGVYQVWIHNAQTGEKQVLQLNQSSSLTGPTAATEYVMTEIDRKGLEPVEPIPAVIDDTLYWQVKVLPDDGRGIKYTAFVNAETKDVTLVREDADVKAFLSDSDEVPDVTESDSDGSESEATDESSTLVITIEHADGSTEQIEVEEGASITIENGDGNETSSDE